MPNRSIILLLLTVLTSLEACLAADPGLGKGYGIVDDPFYRRVQADYRVVWHEFQSVTAELLKTIGSTNAEAAGMLVQIQTNAAFLNDKWETWYRRHAAPIRYNTRDDYLESLRGDLRLLNRVNKPKQGEKPLSVLSDVASDVQLKADNCRNSADGLGKDIKVRVHTKASGKEIGGFEVYYVPRGLLDIKSAHDRFPRQSSPTDEKILCPGRYAVWACKKGFSGQAVTQAIGGHGETRLEMDLEVPAE
jgi:hypothetical protein